MAVDITGLSLVVATMLGVSEAAGGAVCTFILWIGATGFLGIMLQENMNQNMVLAETVFVLFIGTLVGWLDVWWILIMVAVLAILGAFKIGGSAG